MLQILKTSTKNIFSKRLIKNTAQQLTTNLDKPKLTERIEMTQKVTPYEVECSMKKIDYDSIVEEFGCNRIDQKMLERFERLTGKKPHPFMRRGLYFSHRDFDKILDSYEKKEPFYIFTGRGPSEGDMHIGHMIPFIFTQYIQSIFDCPLVIQINDDEKLFFKNVELDTLSRLSDLNMREVAGFGFNPEKTFIFKNTEYIKSMYKNVLEIQKRVTFNQVRAIFGVDTSSSIGKIAFPAIQAAPSFPSTFAECFNGKKLRCLIICAIDQDPYFRMTRDVAPRMNQHKPSLLHCKFLPGLHGVNTKMSASDLTSAIYLNDTPNEIQKKISKSKSGGAQTRYLQKKTGADLEQDVPLMYLRFFLDDDDELKRVEKAYSTGKMETGEVKEMLVKTLTPILLNLQKKKNAVTEELIKKLTTVRQLVD